MIAPFTFAATPQLFFGNGKISILPSTIRNYGTNVLLVTGAKSFVSATHSGALLEQLKSTGITVEISAVQKEPTPQLIDNIVARHSNHKIDVVVAIGGGSVLDAGKAISAMLPIKDSVRNYLEGTGTKNHSGEKVPFIAVPTTAGTGSEATKNAVLSEIGEQGFKKSLRHNNFVPNIVVIDPSLTLTCPKATTAASGMDAFTQLLESYLSTNSNPMSDALAYKGLKRIATSLLIAYHDGTNPSARADMALAAYFSGITLANAGLGLVHGFASSVGGYFDIPHGVICSSIMASSNKVTVRKLRDEKKNNQALHKYALVGKLFSEKDDKNDEYYIDCLLDIITRYTSDLNIPKLREFGVSVDAVDKIVNVTDNKSNPINLTKDEIEEVLKLSL